MKKSASYTILTLVMAFTCLLASQVTVHTATITDGYPGYPNQWDGLTTNTIIEISLDEPVALIGNDPDWDYTMNGNEVIFRVDHNLTVGDTIRVTYKA